MAKVFLSAGHGGSDPGACANGLKEKDINLQTLLACKSELERHGVKVICSRIKDENDPVAQEVREANASGAELAVSFHANAGGGDGFEAFYYPGDEDGERLAKLAEKYVKALGQNSRGIKNGKNLMFINSTNMTAVLFESFFVDNAKDKQIGDTVAKQKKFGVAYAKAILEYLGIKYKEPAAKTTSASTSKPYVVKITAKTLNVRKGPGTSYKVATTVKKGYKYTIVEEKKVGSTTWGKLKSGAGWISLQYAKKV